MKNAGWKIGAALPAALLSACLSAGAGQTPRPVPAGGDVPLCIGGIYPHLAVFNGHGECGIGAVVPWAGKLWYLTYPPHEPRSSNDRLYELDAGMNVRIRPESVGGTHAGRLIHRESNQLIIGPYFVDAAGGVRVADIRKLVGRLTAVARHVADPANKVYFFDMEGAIYEVDVHSLDVTKLFDKPVPGWHGKGAYTGQGRLVIANNGERDGDRSKRTYLVGGDPKGPEEIGILAEWDGKSWRIVERKQFTDVTGPGGVFGSPSDDSPLWAVGWDKRSVILKLLDGGTWRTFRLPKASHCYDPRHGWYTEWPRIREIAPGKLMMDMHGCFYDFPQSFAAGRTGGIRPISTHLRYIPDFCGWDGRLVLASDDASIMKNPMAGQAQSNLWFGSADDLKSFGPRAGWGGPWVGDAVKAGEWSDPFLVAGYDRRVLHVSHRADAPVTFTVEIDPDGAGQWRGHAILAVPATGYRYYIFPPDFDAQWVRLKADRDCRVSAYFHFSQPGGHDGREGAKAFAGLSRPNDGAGWSAGLVRPAGHNRNLQFLARRVSADGACDKDVYYEVDERLRFTAVADEARAEEVRRVCRVQEDFGADEASVFVKGKGGVRYRLPRGDGAFDAPFASGRLRGVRECVSERYLANIHGTFYEIPRDQGVSHIKPVCTHNRRISDFCTWRGLMVLAGVRDGAGADGRCFRSPDGRAALWFGSIDDLWRLGKPVGVGGPWKDSPVKAGEPSDPYLMTNYDRKSLELSHDGRGEVEFTVEVDVLNAGVWRTYRTFAVPPGRVLRHEFPEGYAAHWVRLTAGKDCKASATFIYE